MRNFLIFIIIHQFCCPGFAQTIFRDVKLISPKDGLSQNQGDFMHRDHQGFIWISTDNGLNRFDGRQVKSYKANDIVPGCMAGKIVQTPFTEDYTGNLWFGTESAINCYNRKRDKFEHYFVNADSLIPGNPQRVICLERGRFLWVNADSSLYRFDINAHTTQKIAKLETINYGSDTFPDGRIRRIFACHWLYGKGFEMINFDTSGQIISRQTFFGDPLSGLEIVNAKPESETEVWFNTDKGLLKFNPKYPEEYFIIPKSNRIKEFISINENTYLVVENKGDICFFDKIVKKFSEPLVYINNDGDHQPFKDVFNSGFKDDIVWLSVRDIGLQFFNLTPNVFQKVDIPLKFNSEPVIQSLEFFGKTASISNSGLLTLFEGQYTKHSFTDYGDFFRLYPDGNKYWIVASFQTFLLSDKHQLIKKFSNSYNPNCAGVALNGAFYFGSKEGLFRLNNNSVTPELVHSSNIEATHIFADHQQLIWVGSDRDLKVFRILTNGQFEMKFSANNIGFIHQITQCPVSKNIWVASSNGLFMFYPESDQPLKVVSPVQMGGATCYSVVCDRTGNVWIGTNLGLYQYLPNEETLNRYTIANGLKNNVFNMSAAFRQSNGHIWMGGPNGVDVFDPENLYQRGKKPNIVLTELWVNGHLWSGDESVETAKKIDLQYFENSLTFNFAALEYTDPAHNFYKVKLEGYDTAWLNLEHKATQMYQNLPAGNYKFKVLAANAEGIWQTEALSVDINIAQHFTATWWFRTLVAGFIIGIISIGVAFFLLFRLRAAQLNAEKQQREAEKEQMRLQQEIALRDQREQISTSIHDDLGSGLSNIRIASQRALKRFSEETAQNTLGRIAQLAGELDENRRSLSWATDPEMDNLDSLLSRIRTDAVNIFDQTGVRFTFQAPDKLPAVTLPGPYRLHLLRAIKESLNNILRHAGASEAGIRVQLVKNKKLVILISDNGTGFDPAEKKGSGKGLRAVAKHLHATGGKIEWHKNEDAGMTVRMEAPFPAG